MKQWQYVCWQYLPHNSNPCFRCEGKTEEERNLVISKDTPMNNHINGELSTRPFY